MEKFFKEKTLYPKKIPKGEEYFIGVSGEKLGLSGREEFLRVQRSLKRVRETCNKDVLKGGDNG